MNIEANPVSKTINIYPYVVKVAKKIGSEPLLPFPEDSREQPADVADPTLEEVPEDVPEDERVLQDTLVKKIPTRKRIRK
jgi:hypothetical protein